AVRGCDIQLFQRLLEGPDDLDHVTFGDRAEMPDADHLACHLALAARDHHPVLGVDQRAESRYIETWWRYRRGHRVGPKAFLGVQLETQGDQAGLSGAREAGVSLVDVVEA